MPTGCPPARRRSRGSRRIRPALSGGAAYCRSSSSVRPDQRSVSRQHPGAGQIDPRRTRTADHHARDRASDAMAPVHALRVDAQVRQRLHRAARDPQDLVAAVLQRRRAQWIAEDERGDLARAPDHVGQPRARGAEARARPGRQHAMVHGGVAGGRRRRRRGGHDGHGGGGDQRSDPAERRHPSHTPRGGRWFRLSPDRRGCRPIRARCRPRSARRCAGSTPAPARRPGASRRRAHGAQPPAGRSLRRSR